MLGKDHFSKDVPLCYHEISLQFIQLYVCCTRSTKICDGCNVRDGIVTGLTFVDTVTAMSRAIYLVVTGYHGFY